MPFPGHSAGSESEIPWIPCCSGVVGLGWGVGQWLGSQVLGGADMISIKIYQFSQTLQLGHRSPKETEANDPHPTYTRSITNHLAPLPVCPSKPNSKNHSCNPDGICLTYGRSPCIGFSTKCFSMKSINVFTIVKCPVVAA